MNGLKFDDRHLEDLSMQAQTLDELDVLEALWNEAKEAQRIARLAELRRNSVAMLNVIDRMIGHIDHLEQSPGFRASPVIADLRAQMGAIHAELHDPSRDAPAHDPQVPDPDSDTLVVEGVTTDALAKGEILDVQVPVNATDYEDLAAEYVRFFNGAGIRPSHSSAVKHMAQKAWDNRPRYQSIGTPLGIPWWFIAGLHQMESTFNFQTHLHNGDRLTGRTHRHPPGRPISGNPPFSFEQSATDALKLKNFDGLSDWSLPRALHRFERYNGMGYRSRDVPSPYLWGFTTIYLKGKFVADGVFDGNAATQQCGVAALLRQLSDEGRLKLVSTQFADVEPEPAGLPEPGDGGDIQEDTDAPPSHPFEAFWRENLSDIRHFSWRELLFKGNSQAQFGTNTDPPESHYPRVVPLVRALDEIRARIGGRIRLLSIYRSPQYNADVGGVADSRHKEFDAGDFQVIDPGFGTTSDWARVARDVRGDGIFEGGVGIYNSFIHVDTRGTRANWDSR